MDGARGKLPEIEGIRLSLGGFSMGRPRTLDYDKIKEMYEQDYTLNEIARAIGSEHTSVGDAVERMGLPKRPGHPQGKLDVKKDEIIADYLSGLSAIQVAEKHDCHVSSIKELLARNGIELRHGAKRSDLNNKLGILLGCHYFIPTVEWFQEQLSIHKTAAAIARHYDIPYGTLMERATKLGFEFPVWRGGPGPAGSPLRQEIPTKEAIQLSDEGWSYEKLADRYGVSYGVINRRMREAGYSAPKGRMRKYSLDSVFVSTSHKHKKILEELGIRACEICGEDQVLDFCHIVAQDDEGPTVSDNCLVLCPTHHRKFDKHILKPSEQAKVQDKVEAALAKYGKN